MQGFRRKPCMSPASARPGIGPTDSGQTAVSCWRHYAQPSLATSGEREAGADVLRGEVWKVRENLLGRHAASEVFQNILHGHPQAPDAWLSAAFVRLERNQVSVVHDFTLHPRSPSINAR